MIIIDPREGSGRRGADLYPYIRNLGFPCQKEMLPAADAAFESPLGTIGIERKTISDMLTCIDNSRFSASQKIEMYKYYKIPVLCIEGMWEPGSYPSVGVLFQCYHKHGSHESDSWGPHGQFGGSYKQGSSTGYRATRYSKLYRYLISLSMTRTIVTYSNDIYHTAVNITEWFLWSQKATHTSLTEIHRVAIPEMTGHPSLTRLWAHDIEGVGNLRSMEAEKIFPSPHALANSKEEDWMRIDGIGAPTAKKIIKQIRGWK